MAKKTPEQLTSIEHGAFDTAALQQELAQALEDDRLYKLTDSMKKRAIHTAASYDEFKNLVACADLKPISQKELRDFSRAERQTNISYKKKSRKKPANERRFQPTAPALDVPPATSVDFCRNWKRYLRTTDAKFRYLQITTPERIADMFKPDIDSDLMAEIVEVLVTSWRQKGADNNPEQPPQATFALSTMEALSQTARFSLILDFFDDDQTGKVRELFTLVETTGELPEQEVVVLARLKEKFRLG
ncbi:coiled-coil domain-containing protein 103 [Phytophthora cinnamomi]|uniref:coiled-coil domain-containing protein 103 n=1 Tax=Phytophthora cinnamomi TaxID=4785 RepID=UPI00355A53E0|nr:coiled-coil domain-containing protein 103 [Phytophthora cinnamomi]